MPSPRGLKSEANGRYAIAVLVVPEYFLYIGASFLAYVLSLRFLGEDLRRVGRPRAARHEPSRVAVRSRMRT